MRHRAGGQKGGSTKRTWFVTCRGCGKRGYGSRKAVRRELKADFPDDNTMAAYRCPLAPELWHFGHPQPGDRDRKDAS